MTPQRIQLSRKKGFDLQAVSMALNGLPAVKCSRPSRFGNPYRLDVFGQTLALELFARTIRGVWTPSGILHFQVTKAYDLHHAFLKKHGQHPLDNARYELRGKNLACYCKPSEPYHCDILLEIANA